MERLFGLRAGSSGQAGIRAGIRQDVLREELKCAGITCPAMPVPSCPEGSVLSKSYTPPAGCCPTVPPQCTCDLRACHKPRCPSGQKPVPLSQATGEPGDCCDVFECLKVSPKCVHNGKEFSEGEVYRMDPCWLCQCRGGISFCSKAECAELDCENFYIPEGECCPVCIDVELLSMDSTEASCWLNNKLRGHEEQWKEDDCTFCQCVDGEPHCTAMACKQSCQNPVKIPGECCPFCEGQHYTSSLVGSSDDVALWVCPVPASDSPDSHTGASLLGLEPSQAVLLHSSRSFRQHSLHDSCPDLGKYCSLQCPVGYEKDDFGCEVCECSSPMPKCRPLTCSKTCPYGYVMPAERHPEGEEEQEAVASSLISTGSGLASEDVHGILLLPCPAQRKQPQSQARCTKFHTPPLNKAQLPRWPDFLSLCLYTEGPASSELSLASPYCLYCCFSRDLPSASGSAAVGHRVNLLRNKHGCEMCRCVKCPPFTCDKHCSDGYRQNRKGCSICMCKESGHMPSTTAPTPMPSYCLTSNGHRYEKGESWHDGCRDCYCHTGREMCVLISCPVPSCPNPVVRPDQCCPTCEDESGSGQPEGMDLVVCRAPGGELYVEGETWNLDDCTRCTCRKGRVLCDTEVCPPAVCQAPTRNKDTCCHVCPEGPLLPVSTSQQEYCISSEGDVLLAGDTWKANACTSCSCNNGTIQCFSQRCLPANCRVPVLRKGQCCPHCLEMTTTSVPMMVSTKAPKTSATTTVDNTVWITTATVPPIIAATDGNSLGENFPSQTEMALIYQSAAWILACLLLAIVIFLIVALFINKKKKWVQMSCYSAPKKTVILKKHVNKNSLVYMEPSKENKFQSVKNDCGINFSPEMSSPCVERMSIPRAKLSMGQGRGQR
ncbi:unnamed protein product [Coregonus sp. 'balchen']|nr:unnamed protein product [Coregonus sp. 'balchen']